MCTTYSIPDREPDDILLLSTSHPSLKRDLVKHVIGSKGKNFKRITENNLNLDKRLWDPSDPERSFIWYDGEDNSVKFWGRDKDAVLMAKTSVSVLCERVIKQFMPAHDTMLMCGWCSRRVTRDGGVVEDHSCNTCGTTRDACEHCFRDCCSSGNLINYYNYMYELLNDNSFNNCPYPQKTFIKVNKCMACNRIGTAKEEATSDTLPDNIISMRVAEWTAYPCMKWVHCKKEKCVNAIENAYKQFGTSNNYIPINWLLDNEKMRVLFDTDLKVPRSSGDVSDGKIDINVDKVVVIHEIDGMKHACLNMIFDNLVKLVSLKSLLEKNPDCEELKSFAEIIKQYVIIAGQNPNYFSLKDVDEIVLTSSAEVLVD